MILLWVGDWVICLAVEVSVQAKANVKRERIAEFLDLYEANALGGGFVHKLDYMGLKETRVVGVGKFVEHLAHHGAVVFKRG